MTSVSQSPSQSRFKVALAQIVLLVAGMMGTVFPAHAQAFFPLRDVRPGLHGVGRTIFEGNHIEEFQVEILGVLENTGPQQSIILARLSGGPLAQAGIIQGMSGSPVYIDGKLLGAVALGFAFSKEPIAGIQPIEQMVQGSSFVVAEAGVGAGEIASSHTVNTLGLARGRGVLQLPFAVAPAYSLGNLTQILTPLSLGGFTPETIKTFAPELRKLGFEPQQGVSSGSPNSPDFSGTVQAGSMISVQLISGDFSMGADGTVTYVDGKRVFAFGHRFLDVGATRLPFARSEVITIVPSLTSSFKLSRTREWVGTILSDRATGVAGEIGRSADTIPATIQVNSSQTGAHLYHLQVVNDRLLTPFLMQTALFSVIDATERTIGSGTMRLHTHINFLNGLPALDLHDSFVSDSGLPLQMSSDAVVTLGFLLGSDFNSLQVKDLEFSIDCIQPKQQLYITQAWTSLHTVHPGQSVTITAVLGGENGSQFTKTALYRVPIGAPAGVLNFTVTDANTQNFPEFAGMNAASANTASSLINLVNQYRSADAAYFRVWRPEPAFTLAGPSPGSELTDPPPSVMLILSDPSQSPTSNIAQLATRGSGIAEIRVPVEGFVVSGARTVQVEIKE